jgi:hypothetical protein
VAKTAYTPRLRTTLNDRQYVNEICHVNAGMANNITVNGEPGVTAVESLTSFGKVTRDRRVTGSAANNRSMSLR